MLRKHSQYCQFVMDLKMEKDIDRGRIRDYGNVIIFYRMAYSFFTITSLPSKKIRPSRRFCSDACKCTARHNTRINYINY